jgi:hypothetical protein
VNLSKEIFWDVDYSKLDYVISANWVICRVLDRGSLDDWKEIKGHYGIDKMIDAAKNVRYLSKKTVYFLSTMYNVPLNQFRCYNLMQFQQEQWIY